MFTKKDLRNGDVCVQRCGGDMIYVDLFGGTFVFKNGYSTPRNWNEDLTPIINNNSDSIIDICRVYRPKIAYQCCFDSCLYTDGDLVFDRERDCTPFLDEEEREYLSAVIKPFRNSVSNVKKVQMDNEAYIRITLDNLDVIRFPRFGIDTMYKNMESDRPYTLKELCL